MARARSIKPGVMKNEDIAECQLAARLLFIFLWMLADRAGRLEDRPKRIKAETFPFDTIDVDPLLNELQSFGFIMRYQNADGRFIQIVNFEKHQSPHYSEKPSVIKPPNFQELVADDGSKKPGELPDDTKSQAVINGGAQPPDTQITDSPITDSPSPDSLNPEETHTVDLSTTDASTLALVCVALRDAGIQINPSDPKVIALCQAGATLEEFREAAEIAIGKNKPTIGYVVGIVANRRDEAKTLASLNHAPRKAQTFRESLADVTRNIRNDTPVQIIDVTSDLMREDQHAEK